MARMGQYNSDAFIQLWGGAIASFEGFNTPGSRPARNNNPGDLKFAGQPGAIGKDSAEFAIFPDVPTGFTALYNQLSAYVNNFPSYSIYQIMEHYLGQNITAQGGEVTNQGDSTAYGNFVAAQIGVDPSTTLRELATAASAALAPADPAAPVDDSGQNGITQPGMLVLIVGGAIIFFAITYLFGWE